MLPEDQSVTLRASVLTGGVGIMWLIHAIDAFLPRGWSAAGTGIVPRTWSGLYGIPVAPFIHATWGHLISNSIPLLILGAIVLFRGLGEFLFVTFCSILIGGLGTWLFGEGNAQHVGASGLVFGLFGYLVVRSAFDRKITSAVVTLVVAILYGSAMWHSLIPEPSISWSSHFFGFLGGCVAARLRYPGRHAGDPRIEGTSPPVVELTRRRG
jgi:membrane associated rhomboid family serine protease